LLGIFGIQADCGLTRFIQPRIVTQVTVHQLTIYAMIESYLNDCRESLWIITLIGIQPKKSKIFASNQLNFRLASTVFRDPYQLTLYDEEHSQDEDRWITIGLDETGILRVVVHTFEQTERSSCMIRIISARKATFIETQSYQEREL